MEEKGVMNECCKKTVNDSLPVMQRNMALRIIIDIQDWAQTNEVDLDALAEFLDSKYMIEEEEE